MGRKDSTNFHYFINIKRSFERDKALLKDMGFLLDFENDKWKINDGYNYQALRYLMI